MTVKSAPANSVTSLEGRPVIRIAGAFYSTATRELSVGGENNALEPRLGDLLMRLAKAGGPVSREDLLHDVWGHEGSDEALTQAISKLRRALGDNERPYGIIQTVPKFGYRLGLKPQIVPTLEPANLGAPIHFARQARDTIQRHRTFLSGFAAGLAFSAFIGLGLAVLNPPRTIEREIVCSEGVDSVECNALVAAIDD